jgi:phosphoglycolate phosphatase
MIALIFDFDGTIANSFDEVLAFLMSQSNKSASESGLSQEQLKSLSMRELATKIGIPAWKLPGVFFKGKRMLAKKAHTIPVFEGMSEVIASLHQEKYQLFIISSNGRRNINRFLVQNGLSGYFTRIYSNAGWFGKASILRRALHNHQLEAAKTVYIGDEVRDIVAAHLAGMPSVAVSWGFGSEAELLKYSPTILARTPRELEKALVEWGKTN